MHARLYVLNMTDLSYIIKKGTKVGEVISASSVQSVDHVVRRMAFGRKHNAIILLPRAFTWSIRQQVSRVECFVLWYVERYSTVMQGTVYCFVKSFVCLSIYFIWYRAPDVCMFLGPHQRMSVQISNVPRCPCSPCTLQLVEVVEAIYYVDLTWCYPGSPYLICSAGVLDSITRYIQGKTLYKTLILV